MIEMIKNFPDPILLEPQDICISLYLPARRNSAEQAADQVTFKNLLRELEEKLSEILEKREVQRWMSAYDEIREDKGFWTDSTGGLVIFSTGDRSILYRLREEPLPLVWVGDTFIISPLIHSLKNNKRFYLLGLSLTDFSVYKGDRDGLEEVSIPPETPRTLEEVLGNQHTDGFLTHGKYAGPGTGGGSIFHGQGAKKDEALKDLEKYFRYVDKYMNEEILPQDPLPVVLVTLTEHQGEFRKLSSNPNLYPQGIQEAFDPMKLEEQANGVRKLLGAEDVKNEKRIMEMIPGEMAKGLASDDPQEISRAAEESRVKTLIMSNLRELGNERRTEWKEEMLMREKTALSVLRRGGEVLVTEGNSITAQSDMGAIFRY